MTTEKQRRARTRNWNKAQVKCVEAIVTRMHDSGVMYPLERIALDQILLSCLSILKDWEPKSPTIREEA